MKELWNARNPLPAGSKSVKYGMFLSKKLNNNFVPYFFDDKNQGF